MKQDLSKNKIQELNSCVVLFNAINNILVLERKNNIWEFPGGGVEWSENPKKTAIRECYEETGLTPKKLKLIGITSAVYEKEGKMKHSIYIVYSAKSFSGKLQLSSEHNSYKWVSRKELEKIALGYNAKDIPSMI